MCRVVFAVNSTQNTNTHNNHTQNVGVCGTQGYLPNLACIPIITYPYTYKQNKKKGTRNKQKKTTFNIQHEAAFLGGRNTNIHTMCNMVCLEMYKVWKQRTRKKNLSLFWQFFFFLLLFFHCWVHKKIVPLRKLNRI